MPCDFTVILQTRQHFGNDRHVFDKVEPQAEFVGQHKDFHFDCPNVDPSKTAFLEFQSMDVSHSHNELNINNVGVFGGLPVGPTRTAAGQVTFAWTSNTLLVEDLTNYRRQGTYWTSLQPMPRVRPPATSMTSSSIT
jgi:hypothetical protein